MNPGYAYLLGIFVGIAIGISLGYILRDLFSNWLDGDS